MNKRILTMFIAVVMLTAMFTGIGVSADKAAVAESYIDYSFDNWSGIDSHFQTDGSVSGAKWDRNGTNHVKSYTLATDDARQTKVLKVEPVCSSTNEFFTFRLTNGVPQKYPGNRVVWNEFSVKYEGQIVSIGFDNDMATQSVSVDYKGQIRTGMQHSYKDISSNFGTLLDPNRTLELGKWYHIVSAQDLTSGSAEITVWVNGEKIADKVVPATNHLAPNADWKYIEFTVGHVTEGEATVYVDNLKVYTTNTIDNHAEISITDENPDDYITVDGSKIKTPSKANVGDVKAAFPGVELTFEKDGEPVSDDTVSVVGVIAYVYSDDGMSARPYELWPDTNTHTVTVEGSNAEASGEGEYSVGDRVTVDAGRKDGYKFTGWTVEGIELEDTTDRTVEFIMDATDKKFTANWEYMPTYDVEVIESYTQKSGAGKYYVGEDVRIDAGERPGYTFAGWTIEGIELEEGAEDNPVIEFKMDATPKKFTASWNIIPKYKVEISGSNADDSGAGEYYEGTTVTVKAGNKSRSDFDRWKSSDVTFEDRYEKTTTFVMPAKDVKIVANWYTYPSKVSGGGGGSVSGGPAVYTISFVTNGGSEIAEVKAKNGEVISVGTPVKEGFVFGGWYLDEALTREATLPYTVTGKATFYAKWAESLGDEDTHEPEDGYEWQNPFDDVKESKWYFDAVKYMYERQYCEGLGRGKFGPDISLSRAMLVTILYRIEKKPAADSNVAFADVEPGSWYADAVSWAQSKGIVTGYNSYTFAPNDLITREQIAAILCRYAGYKGQSTDESADISVFEDSYLVSPYAHSSLIWAVAKGYIGGKSEKTLAPLDNATRAEALTVLYRFIKK